MYTSRRVTPETLCDDRTLSDVIRLDLRDPRIQAPVVVVSVGVLTAASALSGGAADGTDRSCRKAPMSIAEGSTETALG